MTDCNQTMYGTRTKIIESVRCKKVVLFASNRYRKEGKNGTAQKSEADQRTWLSHGGSVVIPGDLHIHLDDNSKEQPIHFKKLSWKNLEVCKKVKAGTSEKL